MEMRRTELHRNFYPRPPRGGRPERRRRDHRHQPISIHALREEGAAAALGVLANRGIISIHALREEGDLLPTLPLLFTLLFLSTPSARRATLPCKVQYSASSTFLSTPSARRATLRYRCWTQCLTFLSTPSARRATQSQTHDKQQQTYFYPRPPRGGRQCSQSRRAGTKKFLSTPSARRATKWRCIMGDSSIISIHALREEGDA